MAWGAVLKGVGKAAAGGAKKIAKDKLLNRKKNVKNRRAKAQEAIGGGGERGGALAIRPTTPLAPTIGGGALATIGGSGGGGGAADNTPEGIALNISTNIIKVENLLKNSYTMKQKVREDARKQSKIDEDKEQEKALEKVKKPKSKIKIPGAKAAEGLLGKVFNFIGAMLLGWIAVRWQEWLPKLIAILKPIAAIADWIINVAGVILDALAGIIDFGYKLVDKMEGWVKDIYGEEGAEKFKTFMTNLKDLIAGFLVWKIIGEKMFKAFVGMIKNAWKAVTGAIRKAWVTLKRMVGRKARIFFKNLVKRLSGGLKSVGGKVLNVGKGLLGKAGGLLSKGGGALAKTGGAKVVAKVGGWAAKIFGKAAAVIAPALKAATPAIKGFAGRIPILGPLIVAIVSLMSGEPIGQALFKGIGAALGGALGTFIPIPFLGTLLGETIGAFVGDLLYYTIIEKDPGKAFEVLKQTVMGIFGFLTKIPILGTLFKKLGEGGNIIWTFGKWLFFDGIGWVLEKLGGAAKLLKEWFEAGMQRFQDNFPVFDLPLMKFGIGPINVDINWLLGKSFGQIPWFKQWVNDEDQLMHFPDFSMFIPVLGIPFLIGHTGKSLFPGSFFENWPSGVSSFTNPIGKALGAKIDKNKEELDKSKDKKSKVTEKTYPTGLPGPVGETFGGKGGSTYPAKLSDNQPKDNNNIVKDVSTKATYEDSSAGTIKISPPTTTSSETSSGDTEAGAVKFIPVSSGGGDPYEELDFFG